MSLFLLFLVEIVTHHILSSEGKRDLQHIQQSSEIEIEPDDDSMNQQIFGIPKRYNDEDKSDSINRDLENKLSYSYNVEAPHIDISSLNIV